MSMAKRTTIQSNLTMLQNLKRQAALMIVLVTGFSTSPLQADVDTPVEDTAYLLCGGCHGPENVRVENMSPNIIGQKKDYLAKQLKAFRDGKRAHPSMNDVMEPYSDKNIEDLANYYANTSTILPGGTP
jgi:cytochrome c553